ncbi:MAG TPA: hypothetical protein VH599_17055 [Ktedonobacterales bacterium]
MRRILQYISGFARGYGRHNHAACSFWGISDIFGRVRLYTVGFAIFTVGSTLDGSWCASATALSY